MRPSVHPPAVLFAGCLLLAGCATGAGSPTVPDAFDLVPAVREAAERVAPARAGRPLRAYALSIRTSGGGPASRIDVLGRQARLQGGVLASVTGSRVAGAFGMSRSMGLCGLVSLRLDTALADRAYLPDDPARAGDIRFDAASGPHAATRMHVTELRVEGSPCAPRPAEAFAIALKARGEVVGEVLAGAVVDARYDCVAAPAVEPASRLHPDLPGDMLRVDCRRTVAPGGASGLLSYAWFASGGVYLLTGHRGPDIAQDYVYTDVVLEP